MALRLNLGKFITGFETCFTKKFIGPEQKKYVTRNRLYKMPG